MSLHRLSEKERASYQDRNSRTKSSSMLDTILDSLNIRKGVYLEVGAHNGVSASPTRHLLDRGWSAFFIEGDKDLYEECRKNMSNFSNVKIINQYIGLESGNRLDDIIEEKNDLGKIEVLVIDIDSYDYWIFLDLRHRPPVIIIEMNPYILGDLTIPYGEKVDRTRTFWGASDSALYRLAKEKKYTCVGMSNCKGWNLFFVANEIFEKSNLVEYKIQDVKDENFILTHPGFIRRPSSSTVERKS